MNERIGTLLNRSGGEFYEGFAGSPNTVKFTEEELQTFAKLIVRECAKALNDKLSNPNGASMAYCDGSDLLEHFGFKE